ncbi:aspartyl protease family protein At5g10770-like [Lolium perenne]|uniref:aspartyl protease family protein At5g10770-like n=1 Tax=Lolium perenne TaxID=4522 RepID=UPI0021EAD16D|nr:aspartyl protease family protein At5g10770-like [Lolium perenne]
MAAFVVSPSQLHRVLLLSWLLFAAGVLCFLPRHVAAARVGAGSYVTVSAASLAASGTTCDDPAPAIAPRQLINGTSAVLRLAHRHGPCAAPSRSSVQPGPPFAEVLRADQRRAEYIQRRVSGARGSNGNLKLTASSRPATVPATMGYSIGTLQYVVTVILGTPGVPQTVELDTGSDVSWVQCKPCAPPACYSQKDPLFDPAGSSTYSAVPCAADACLELEIFGEGCSSSQCRYVVSYGDGSNTTGVYGSDTLTLSPGNTLSPFLFGCGYAQTGLFAGIDGLLGLGRQSMSLKSQAAGAYGGVFSYCLPPKETSTGYLTLGAPSTASGFATTALLTAWNAPTFYMVMLTGISVGGQAVGGVPTSVFAGGTVVDTGTVVTRLPPTAYAALRSTFRAAMARYGYPSAPPIGILDTCYNFSRYDAVTLPTVALVFGGGATLALEAPGILSSGCLAFAPNAGDGDAAILGNVQQRSVAVRFDGSSVGFMPGAC